MNIAEKLHHNLIQMPTNRKTSDPVGERHEFVLLFDCAKSNPNGDPDTGNMPRVQPDSLKGLVTDVCLKRKIRNFFSLYNPDAMPRSEDSATPGYQIFIRENAILRDDLDLTHQARGRFLLSELLDQLASKGFLTDEAKAEILREVEFVNFPEKPKDCAAFVLKICGDKLDYAPLVAAAATALEARREFGQPLAAQMRAFSLPAQQAETEKASQTGGLQAPAGSAPHEGAEGAAAPTDQPEAAKPKKPATQDEGAVRAILEKAKQIGQAAGKGIWKTAQGVVKEALDKQKPSALLEAQFGTLSVEKAVRSAVCECYFDVRAFGAVISTKGPLEGSFYGQVRGPVQFTFAESLDKILPLDASITRCAVASTDDRQQQNGDESGNRTMGRKFGIDYGLYRCHIHFSPAFAAKTGFTYYDLDNFLFALKHMFDDDHAAGRHLRLVGLVDFQHQSALGNAPAHKLFNLVDVRPRKQDGTFLSSGSEFPRSLDDYEGTGPGAEYHVTGHGDVEPGKNGEGVAVIKATCIVWEIPRPVAPELDKGGVEAGTPAA
jgi:CRISPR-associated protein Cas7/Csd2 subtype I-C